MKIISEKALYKFIFCQSALAEEERLFISENSEKFKADLDYLREIKSSLDNTLPDSILDKIHKKINKASVQEGVTLNLVIHPNYEEKCIFAADSETYETKQHICSYVDESNNFLIKSINKDDVNKIYIFSKEEIEDLEYSVTLFPSKEIYFLNSEDMPLIISPRQKIKSILLKSQ